MIQKWLCDCTNYNGNKTILGFIEDKKILRIKRKDLFVEIEGGKVTINCYVCGKRHTLTDDSYLVIMNPQSKS